MKLKSDHQSLISENEREINDLKTLIKTLEDKINTKPAPEPKPKFGA